MAMTITLHTIGRENVREIQDVTSLEPIFHGRKSQMSGIGYIDFKIGDSDDIHSISVDQQSGDFWYEGQRWDFAKVRSYL